MNQPEPVRVCVVQQIVPHYRVPLFSLLAQQPGIDLTVCSGQTSLGSLKHVSSPGTYREGYAPIRFIAGIGWQPAQVALARSHDHDVIIYSWNARLVHLPRALRAARKRRVPTLLWGHGIGKHDSRWREALRDRLIRLSGGCILYGSRGAQRLVNAGHDPSRVHIAPNAIDQSTIREARSAWLSDPSRLSEFRSQHQLENRKLLVFVSRLEPIKRVDVLLEVMARIRHDHPSALLAIIGSGPAEAALRKRAADLDVTDNVRFVGALFKEDELAPWLLSSICMPYTTNLGLSVLHAFGYGVPVITSDDPDEHGPEVDALQDGRNGLLYRTGDVAHFEQQVRVCLEDDRAQAQLASAALESVRSPDGYCLERTVSGFLEAIASVRR